MGGNQLKKQDLKKNYMPETQNKVANMSKKRTCK